jgi:hypothetical protein
MADRSDSRRAGNIIIGGFLLALAILVVWFALDFGGLMPGDQPVLTPDAPASVVPEAAN